MIRTVLYLLYVFLVVITLLEVLYRFQIVDFFRAELHTLNSVQDIENPSDKKTILVCGDSFSAQAGNYVQVLRDSLPRYRIINAAVTGCSPEEGSLILPQRVKKFNPDIIIYQLYVGNDLLGMNHTLNWENISWTRNIYWWLADRIHVLWYINYKLGQLSTHRKIVPDDELPSTESSFDPITYRQREKLYALADPGLINNSVMLRHGREEDMARLNDLLRDMAELSKPDCQFYILVIPHKAQVSSSYKANMKDIGFTFDPDFSPNDYPFVVSLNSIKRARIINPLPILQQHAVDTSLYFNNDEHLTSAGHVLVAHQIISVLPE